MVQIHHALQITSLGENVNEKFYLHNKQLIDQKINDCLINMALTAEDLKALTLANQLNNMTRAQFIAACGCDV